MSKRLGWSLVALACVGFWAKLAGGMHQWHLSGFNDATSEALTIGATRNFLEEGFAPSFGLPVYRGMHTDTPIYDSVLKEKGFYTHFLPGPEYVLYGFFKVFGPGERGIFMARFPGSILFFLSILAFCLLAEKRVWSNWPWGKGLALAWIFAAPAVYSWAPSIHGHAYSSASVFLALSLGLVSYELRNRSLFPLAFLAGIICTQFQTEAMFITCAAPLVGSLLLTEDRGWKRPLAASIVVGLGVSTAFTIHFWQVARALGSWDLAWLDQFGTVARRSSYEGIYRERMIGDFAKYAAAAFRTGSLAMLCFGLFFSWLHIGTRSRKARLTWAIALSCVAGYAFPLLFKVHSHVHWWRVHRVFQLEFAVFVAIALSLVQNHLKVRASRAPARESVPGTTAFPETSPA